MDKRRTHVGEARDLRARLEVMGTGHYLAAFIGREGVAFGSAFLDRPQLPDYTIDIVERFRNFGSLALGV
jgi:hypothetical protein